MSVVELDNFLLRVNECWATQSQDPDESESLVHTLLQNGFDHFSKLAVHISFVL